MVKPFLKRTRMQEKTSPFKLFLKSLGFSLWIFTIFSTSGIGIGIGISPVDAGGIFETMSKIITASHTAYKEFCDHTPPPEAHMSTSELVNHHGYPVEEHKVVTEDGFVLTIFRIPYGKTQRIGAPKKEPVIIYHGFIQSSDDWLLLENFEDNLPYLLVNDGHEVWLANIRGNTYSQDPTLSGITPDDTKYYDYGFDEVALYDLPAVVEHIVKISKNPKVSYIGFSLGGGIMPLALSALSGPKSKFSQSIKKITLLAPGLYVEHLRSPAFNLLFAIPAPILLEFENVFSGGRILPAKLNDLLHKYAPQICTGDIGIELCDNIIFIISGYDREQTTDKTASLVSGHTPSEMSVKVITQIQQQRKTKPITIQKFDYGPEENLKRYGTKYPTPYNLSEVRVPTQVFYGANDLLVSVEDTLKAISELGNVQEAIQVSNPNWTHLDFNYAKDAKFYVYDKIVDFMST